MDSFQIKNLSRKNVWIALLFTLFLATSLQGDSVEKLLKDANTLYKKNTPYNLKRSYQLFKKAYSGAKKNKSNYQTYQSLNGIVKVGKKLKYNIKDYENRFRMLELPKYKDYSVSEDKLVIRFDRNLKKSYYKYFRLNDKKLVVDIYGDFPRNTIRVNNKFIKKITIANYQLALTRVVLETKEKKLFNINIWKNAIVFDLKGKKSSTKPFHKSSPTKKVSKEKKAITKNVNSFIRTGNKKVIVIDAGHGGRDSGAVGYRGAQEKKIVFSIAKKFEKELKRRGFKTYMTRTSDKYIKLTKRTKFANEKNAHLFISIHANSVPVRKDANGIEVYFLSKARTNRAKRVAAKENAVDLKAMESMSKKTFLNFLNREKIVSSNKLAIDLQKGMLDSLRSKYSSVKDGGVREGPFWVLVGAQMPAVLVETGFVSNKKEALRLQNSHYQDLLAKGLTDGVERFFINNGKL